MNEDPVQDALDALLKALRDEVREEEKISVEVHRELQMKHMELGADLVILKRDFEELNRRNQGMLNHLQRIRTKADMASGYENESGGSEEASEKGRSAGAEGAVDRLIALYAGKVTKESKS